MAHPLLFEVNTRCWLRALSNRLGKSVTLASAPEEEIDSWKELGFTHTWLMGVWATGPKTLEHARAQPGLRALAVEAFGAGGGEKLVSSPYAIADYAVAESLGGSAGLRKFREQLRRRGMGLVLDFVPNHVGPDHPWLTARNELFVRSDSEKEGTFLVKHEGGKSWVAHGKDPYFPPWSDTAQLDYRLPATRGAMIEVLQSVAAQCDGVRCDMAMLLLNDVFNKNWAHFTNGGPEPKTEFWTEAISAVKKLRPDFMFMAEAYWDLETRLHELGFDCAYDKRFYDHLKARDFPALHAHAKAVNGKFNPVRFLENHDEMRIASILTVPEAKAAAVLLLAQAGPRLLHDGQLTGARQHSPVQFADYWPEGADAEMAEFYERLLALLSKTAIGRGEMQTYDTGLPHCFALKWSGDGRTDLVLANLAAEPAKFQLKEHWPAHKLENIHSDPESSWSFADGHLEIALAAHGFELLELRPMSQ